MQFKPHRTHKGMSFTEFLGELKDVYPSAVVLGEELSDRYPMYLEWDKKRSTAVSMTPPAIINLITDADCPEFSAAHVKLLESATRGQAENPVWIEQRVS